MIKIKDECGCVEILLVGTSWFTVPNPIFIFTEDSFLSHWILIHPTLWPLLWFLSLPGCTFSFHLPLVFVQGMGRRTETQEVRMRLTNCVLLSDTKIFFLDCVTVGIVSILQCFHIDNFNDDNFLLCRR